MLVCLVFVRGYAARSNDREQELLNSKESVIEKKKQATVVKEGAVVQTVSKGLCLIAQLAALVVHDLPKLVNYETGKELDKTAVLSALEKRTDTMKLKSEKSQQAVNSLITFTVKLFSLFAVMDVKGLVDVSVMTVQLLALFKDALDQNDQQRNNHLISAIDESVGLSDEALSREQLEAKIKQLHSHLVVLEKPI